MIRTLVPHDSPILRTVCEKFDTAKPPFDPVEFAHDLAQTMISHGALGLAAPQVGVPYRVIAVSSNPVGVLYNPIIVDRSSETNTLEEGCLSFPGLILHVERPRAIKVRYSLPNGEVVTKVFVDTTARIICHEVDHLDGKTIIDVQPGLKRDFARKKWAKIVRHGIPVRKAPGVVDTAEMVDKVASLKRGDR